MEISYRPYTGEADLPHIMALVQTELSEPYVIYTYRYFLHQWYVPASSSAPAHPAQAPARVPRASPVHPPAVAHRLQAIPAGSSVPIGVIVCKQSMHKHAANRGYIAMLSVNKNWRKRGVGEPVPPLPLRVSQPQRAPSCAARSTS
jgi:peptide alpha-N-acetyltransferase